PGVLSADLDDDLLEARAEVTLEDRRRGACHAAHLRAEVGGELVDRALALGLGHELYVDVAHVYRPRAAFAQGGVGVLHLRLRAYDARGFFCLEPGVLEIRSRWRLDLHDELGAIVHGEERRADGAD